MENLFPWRIVFIKLIKEMHVGSKLTIMIIHFILCIFTEEKLPQRVFHV